MYESYSWPGASSLKFEIHLFKIAIKSFFSGILKESKNKKKI